MNGRLLLAFGLFALAASAGMKSYTIILPEPATMGNMELKPGSYRVDVGDQSAVIHNGRQATEVPVKVETNGSKYPETTFKMYNHDGKLRVDEIHLGGTKTKLVLGAVIAR